VLIDLAGKAPLSDLQVHQIRRFVAQLHGRGLGGRTLARILSAWRGFFTYLARDHRFGQNPCLGIRPPKAARRLPHALSPDEAHRLMDVSGDGPLALRDKAMLELFYSSGLRLSELTGLAPIVVNYGDGTVRVTGKGAKTRIIPVGRHAVAALKSWLAARARVPGVQHDAYS
jgi:integrase/recombinase XerC